MLDVMRQPGGSVWDRNQLGPRFNALLSALRIALKAGRLEHPFLRKENLFESLTPDKRVQLIRQLDEDMEQAALVLFENRTVDGN